MTKRDKLKQEMNVLRRGQTRPLLEVVEYSKRQKVDLEEFWRNIPPATMEELDGEQLRIISGEQDPTAVVIGNDNDPMADLMVARHFLDPKFKVARHKNQIFLHEIIDTANKILSPIYEGDATKILERYLSQALLAVRDTPLLPFKAKQMALLWENHAPEIPMPKPMALPDEDIWCLHRPLYSPDADAPFIRWPKILGRMSDPLAFAAWVWAIYTGLYKGRQVLWLHGPHGEDGKSTIAKLIAEELFGPAHNAISNASLGANEKRFLNSFFEHAALVIYPDANNTKCLLSEAFKTVASAGSDPVLIERKGRQAFTSVLHARMWVCSNHPPQVTKDNFALSRLLYIKIDKLEGESPDPSVREELKQELPAFLHYAEQAYSERCTDHYKVMTEVDTEEVVMAMADSFYEEYETIFSKHWEVGTEEDYVEAGKLRDIVRKEGIRSTNDQHDFLEWLIKEKGIIRKKRSSDHGRIRYMKMRKRGTRRAADTGEIKW